MTQRYEREIDELLYRLETRRRRDSFTRRLSHRVQPFADRLRRALRAFLRRPPTEQFIITGLGLVVASYLLNMAGAGRWASYLSLLSLVLFILGMGIALATRHSQDHRKRWRGREVEYRGPDVLDKLRGWFKRRRHR